MRAGLGLRRPSVSGEHDPRDNNGAVIGFAALVVQPCGGGERDMGGNSWSREKSNQG